MEIFFSAGEASSDLHAAKLLAEIRKAHPEPIQAFGLGGDALAAEGYDLLMHARSFSVMGGPFEVMGKLPLRRKLEKTLEDRLLKRRPAGAVLVDNGEINLRLASLLHFFGVPVVYYIPPKVWVWRHSRIEAIADHISLVLSILPFEKEIYDAWEIPFEYVGHPIVGEAPKLTAQEAKQRLGLKESDSVLAVFPGSRHSEVRYHIELFSEALKKFSEKLGSQPKPIVAIPVPGTLNAKEIEESFRSRLSGMDVRVYPGKNYETLAAARAALVKSGTSTLEAAYYKVPMVLSYKSSKTTEWLYRALVRYRGYVGMANLFLEKDAEKALGWKKGGKPVIPEYVLDLCKPDLIAQGLSEVYLDTPLRTEQLAKFETLSSLLRAGSVTAAQAALEVFTGKRAVKK